MLYHRTPENTARLVASLEPLRPYLRGAPPGLPFRFDAATVERGLNFTLDTTLGALDLLGEVAGGGRYQDLLQKSQSIRLFGYECRCVTLEALIVLKRAAGRPKDLEILAELESLLDRQRS